MYELGSGGECAKFTCFANVIVTMENGEFSARSLFASSSSADAAASVVASDAGSLIHSFLLSNTGTGGLSVIHHPAASGLSTQHLASSNTSAGVPGQDDSSHSPSTQGGSAADTTANQGVLAAAVYDVTARRAERPLDQEVRRHKLAQGIDDEIHEDFKELNGIIEDLEEIEADTDVFSIPSVIRSDALALFGRVVETILILLAVQHSDSLTKGSSSLIVTPLLFMMVYFGSQVQYMITHWSRMISLAKRRISKTEKEEILQKNKMLKAQAELNDKKQTEAKAAIYNISTEGPDQETYSPHPLKTTYPAHGVYTLAQVRLASSESVFAFISKILYLVNVYITFLFIKAVLDKINASFSDGMWIMAKANVFILIVIPVYIEFQVAGYRQDVVCRSIRLTA